MEFGELPLDQAVGAILAHSIGLPQGRLRKGVTLGASDIAALHAAGIEAVTVARLGATDLHEDAAAQTLAQALVPAPECSGVSLRVMGTGRVNIVATRPGILDINVPQIHALNATHPMITLATLSPWQRVAAGDLLATVKIISYGVPQAAVALACTAGAGALAVRSVMRPRVVLIQTSLGDADGQKGHRVTETRVQRLGGTLAPLWVVPHQAAPLAAALDLVLQKSLADLILILTASATSDQADTAPAALRAAGGRLEHFGMPVDPGNLLFLGALGETPVIGLPGCAKSPALNGADWVLERVMCGLDLSGADIAAMGVGGLLKEITTRPRPRDIVPTD